MPMPSIGTSESPATSEPWLPPPAWCDPARSVNSQPSAAETSTSPAFRIAERRLHPLAAARVLVEQRRVLVAVAARDDRAVLDEERRVHRVDCVEARGCDARLVRVDHRRAIRRGDERGRVDVILEPRRLVDVRLPVIGAEDDGVALEELVEPAGRLDERPHREVDTRERLVRSVGPVHVRREIEVREVVHELVEAVAGHEPPADRRRVLVGRAGRAVAHRERRADGIRLVEVVEEEAPRPEGGRREPGHRRQVAVPPAVAGDVHCGRDEARVLDRFVDRLGVLRQMLLVEADDRVAQ